MNTFIHYLTLPYLLGGALVTLEITAGAFVVGLVGGLILAAIQLSGLPVLPLVVRLYAIITRGTPLLLQLLFVYDVLPTRGHHYLGCRHCHFGAGREYQHLLQRDYEGLGHVA